MNKKTFISEDDYMDAKDLPNGYLYGYLYEPIRTNKTYYLFGFIKLETIHNVTHEEAKKLLKPYLRPFVKIK